MNTWPPVRAKWADTLPTTWSRVSIPRPALSLSSVLLGIILPTLAFPLYVLLEACRFGDFNNQNWHSRRWWLGLGTASIQKHALSLSGFCLQHHFFQGTYMCVCVCVCSELVTTRLKKMIPYRNHKPFTWGSRNQDKWFLTCIASALRTEPCTPLAYLFLHMQF